MAADTPPPGEAATSGAAPAATDAPAAPASTRTVPLAPWFDAGSEVRTAGNRPAPIDPSEALVLVEGEADVFVVPPGDAGGAPRFVASLARGDVVLGGAWFAGQPGEAVRPGDAGGPAAPDAFLRGVGPAVARAVPLDTLPEADLAEEPSPGEGPDGETPGELRSAVLRWRHHLATFLASDAAHPEQARANELEARARRDAFEEAQEREATSDLASAVEAGAVGQLPTTQEPLLRAIALVATAAGSPVDQRRLDDLARGQVASDPRAVCAQLRLPVRPSRLDRTWWHSESGPFLAQRTDGSPVALLPQHRAFRKPAYRCVDPAAGTDRRVTPAIAAELEPTALSVYGSLPDRPIGVRDLFRTGLAGSGFDLRTFAATALVIVALATAMPIATAHIVGSIIPSADRSGLAATTAILIAVVVASFFTSVLQAIAVLRITTRMNVRLGGGVWNRVLHLGPSFFRTYPAGELARRVLAVDELRDLVSGSTVAAVVSVLVAVASSFLFFLYQPLLGLLAAVVVAAALVVAVLILRRQLGYRRVVISERNRLAGTVLEMLSGIAKIRVGGAERRAHAAWARRFSRQQAAQRQVNLSDARITVLTTVLPTATTLVIILGAEILLSNQISAGDFVGLTSAVSQFTVAVAGIVPVLSSLLMAIPLYESTKPVLHAVPEVHADAADPGTLRGEVELAGVTYTYLPDAPPALVDVTLKAAPGSFVGIVGPSGAGKSTLIRILLGFDQPSNGAVLFDGRQLDTLDVAAVRRQIGTVIQGARVSAGSILTNIIGTMQLTEEEAWAAAELAGLADDIRHLPMGMHTMVSEGGSGFSGGQLQRLLLARALVRRPRIVILDEATSALDNETQAIVSHSLQSLGATRLVVAHRLSTIEHADQLYVLDRGRVVEHGTFDELVNAGGMFTKLAERQLL